MKPPTIEIYDHHSQEADPAASVSPARAVVKKHRLTLLVITDWVHHDATRVVEDVRRDILTDKIGTLFEHVLTTPGLIIVVVVIAIGVETFCKKEGA